MDTLPSTLEGGCDLITRKNKKREERFGTQYDRDPLPMVISISRKEEEGTDILD